LDASAIQGDAALMSAAPLRGYSRAEKLLHWLALQPESVRRLSFDLDRQFFLPEDVTAASAGAVYVCGLARSGTTLLLQLLEQWPCFRSLTYRDMPFVLAPNLWRQLTRHSQRNEQLAQRAHGDGVLVGYDSPEAFEEVFWQTFSTSLMRPQEGYGYSDTSDEALDLFAQYRALVANPSGSRKDGEPLKRYLSKNNDNLLRFDRLAQDPSATVLLVFRNPIDTALSLHRQHLNFMARQADPFVARYMSWLGHHEFGPGHLPFHFAKPRMNPALRAVNLDYWMDYWVAVYSFVLERFSPRVFLVNYDDLVVRPESVLFRLCAAVDLPPRAVASIVRSRPPSVAADAMLAGSPFGEAAEALYAELCRICSGTDQLGVHS
jgi:hypothetical protein